MLLWLTRGAGSSVLPPLLVRWALLVALMVTMTTAVRAQGSSLDTQRAAAGMEALVAREFGGLVVARQATNLQTFTGNLGGIAASPITDSGTAQRRFLVDGSTFTDFASAASRSCSDQHNSCANLANSNKNIGFTVGACDTQQTQCNAAASTATQTAFQVKVSSNANFDFFCDE